MAVRRRRRGFGGEKKARASTLEGDGWPRAQPFDSDCKSVTELKIYIPYIYLHLSHTGVLGHCALAAPLLSHSTLPFFYFPRTPNSRRLRFRQCRWSKPRLASWLYRVPSVNTFNCCVRLRLLLRHRENPMRNGLLSRLGHHRSWRDATL